ncbi:hypothetical protein QE197_25630 (plasmid) [Arsenophonus nasoniae]|uniref:Uncharacterized protein n=2 Tax=Arsenophonus nasoniae TaxID=638 RepID=D2U0J8_9GAMM|nr:hypothetical protein [Arsenophonus nasoniae]QBY46878.1 hypothetical protein ArsFIN_54890 [Arsenophonus nasoniae]WGM13889.1 hypothetical protein QE197_25630 [Arsenophonus nasoniae]WGM18490.1 hypothetical protein QE193_25420 [Arsenophonus nasoniae]CBA73878.1 hypothetical protein ARN_20260 [Arsenophonus nasoniae]
MEDIYKKLINEIHLFIKTYKINTERKGTIKRIIANHIQLILELNNFFTQKELVERLNQDLKINIDYNYFNRTINSLNKKNKIHHQVISKKQNILSNNHKGNDNSVKTDKKSSLFSHKEYPLSEITPEKKDKLSHLNYLSEMAKNKVIQYDITEEELKMIGVNFIPDKSKVFEEISKYCEKKEQKFKEEFLTKMFKRGGK